MTYRMTLSRIAWVAIGVGLALLILTIVLAASASTAQAGHRCHTERQCRDRGWEWHSHGHHAARYASRPSRSPATRPAPVLPIQTAPEPPTEPAGTFPVMLGEFLPAPIPDMFGNGIGFIPPAVQQPLIAPRQRDVVVAPAEATPTAAPAPKVLRASSVPEDRHGWALVFGILALGLASSLAIMPTTMMERLRRRLRAFIVSRRRIKPALVDKDLARRVMQPRRLEAWK